ncbi:MAG: hypothetical protein INR65_03480 [Gluconacetobacter diazotrophicus]|nr:hypothetical protein [Gluconacetobacter diazotrophicus]
MEILYEDAEVRAVWSPGGSDHLLVSFGDRTELIGSGRFCAERAVRKAGISCIGITAREPNWYPVDAMRRLWAAVTSRLDEFAVRIGYGGSMGGYGAIKHSGLLGLTHVVALAPQWSIDSAECEGHYRGGHYYFRPGMAGHGVRTHEVSGRVVIAFDPGDPVDGFHARRLLEEIPGAWAVRMPSVGHHVSRAFAGTAKLQELIAAVREGDGARLQALGTRWRRTSRERAFNLLAAGSRRQPKRVARLLARPEVQLTDYIGPAPEFLLPLLERLLAGGAAAEARVVAATIREWHPAGAEVTERMMSRNANAMAGS